MSNIKFSIQYLSLQTAYVSIGPLDFLYLVEPPQIDVQTPVLEAVAVVPVPPTPHTDVDPGRSGSPDRRGHVVGVSRPHHDQRVEDVAVSDLDKAETLVVVAAVRVDGTAEAAVIKGREDRVQGEAV